MSGIIVGFDGSAHSARALEWAMSEAVLRHTPLTVLTVHQVVPAYWRDASRRHEEHSLLERDWEMARGATDKALAQLGDRRPLCVTITALSGIPAAELLGAAEDADMVVVGSRGAGGFTRLPMGWVCTQLTHRAHCPVVVIPVQSQS